MADPGTGDSAGRPGDAPGLTGGGPYRYARWDGRQRFDDWTADDLLTELSDDLLADSDLSTALARLLGRGRRAQPGREALPGLRDLTARLASARDALLSRFELGDVLADVRREVDEIVAAERRTVERRVAGAAAGDAGADDDLRRLAADLAGRRQAELAALPQDVGGRLRALAEYDFLDVDARTRFDALVDRLRREVLDSQFAGLADAIRGVNADDLAANREMVRELNRLLQERLSGGDPDASDFLSRHGAFFPGARTLDDVIDQLADRMAAMQSLMASLTAEQRHELQQMMDALLRDDRLRWDLAQLASTLDQLLPGGLGRRYDFSGADSLSLESALGELGRLTRMEQLAAQIGAVGTPDALADIDPAELADLVDASAADDLRRLQEVARRLEEAGYAERHGSRLELTPLGARRLGQTVLDELFGRLRRDVFGGHARRAAGAVGERGETTRRYEFGRPFDLHVQRTLANALARGSGRDGAPVTLQPADFEIYESDDSARAATVLLVDMSRSMLLRGCYVAAKKVALALDMLIRTRFPHDELHVIGFAYYARQIAPNALASLAWHGYEYGTNLQHGLLLARRLLARSHAANRSVVVITDGEPTAHFEGGQVEFSYPPTRQTVRETLREVARCTRAGITINTFMLERSRALTEFVDRMTRLNGGRAFFAAPEQLGEYVLVDYVDRRRRA